MGAISDITAAIAGHAAGLSAMRGAPARPPDSISAFPFAITYCSQFNEGPNDATFKTGLGTWRCDIHLGRLPDVGRVLNAYEQYLESFPDALFGDLDLDGACDNIIEVRAILVPLDYNGIETFAYRFEIDLKYENAIS